MAEPAGRAAVAPVADPIVFLFIGAGSGYRPLRAAVAARRLDHVLFRPYQERAQLALSLTAPDVHLVTLRPAWEGLVMPSKLYGALAAGRPVVSGRVAILVAASAAPRATTSAAMWPASEIRASDPDIRPTTSSTTPRCVWRARCSATTTA